MCQLFNTKYALHVQYAEFFNKFDGNNVRDLSATGMLKAVTEIDREINTLPFGPISQQSDFLKSSVHRI